MNPFKRRTRATHGDPARRQSRVGTGRGPRAQGRSRRRAFTILDVIVGLVVATVVGGAIGGILILVSRAMPQTAAATTPTTVSSARLADEIASELRYATSFTEMTPTSVTFTVPDRDGDGAEETIRFSWTGIVGQPVTRMYNNGSAVEIFPSCHNLSFIFSRTKKTITRGSTALVTSPETLLDSFTGWTGITATQSNLTVGTSAWNSQAFRIDPAILPAGAKNLKITKVRLKMKKPLLGGADAHVSIHRRQTAGSDLPAAAPVGSVSTINFALLTLSFAWVDATFSDASFATPETELCIVIKGPLATSAQVQYLNANTAPADTHFFRWTTDGGVSWLPTSGVDRNDAYYEVWGTWQSPQTTTTQTDVYFLTSVDVGVDGGKTDGFVRASARVLNRPEVPAP